MFQISKILNHGDTHNQRYLVLIIRNKITRRSRLALQRIQNGVRESRVKYYV